MCSEMLCSRHTARKHEQSAILKRSFLKYKICLQRDPVAEQALCTRYELTETEDAVRMLEQIATNRSCIKKGGELDYSKAAALLLDEFRSGIIGRMTLERPEEYGE